MPIILGGPRVWSNTNNSTDRQHCLRSAIDNATRGLIQLGQLSVTAGLYFSLGHSTIVVVVVGLDLSLVGPNSDERVLDCGNCYIYRCI